MIWLQFVELGSKLGLDLLIGRKDIGRVDVPSKTNGTAQYGMDVQVPGMIYAAVLESPMEGSKAPVSISSPALGPGRAPVSDRGRARASPPLSRKLT